MKVSWVGKSAFLSIVLAIISLCMLVMSTHYRNYKYAPIKIIVQKDQTQSFAVRADSAYNLSVNLSSQNIVTKQKIPLERMVFIYSDHQKVPVMFEENVFEGSSPNPSWRNNFYCYLYGGHTYIIELSPQLRTKLPQNAKIIVQLDASEYHLLPSNTEFYSFFCAIIFIIIAVIIVFFGLLRRHLNHI